MRSLRLRDCGLLHVDRRLVLSFRLRLSLLADVGNSDFGFGGWNFKLCHAICTVAPVPHDLKMSYTRPRYLRAVPSLNKVLKRVLRDLAPDLELAPIVTVPLGGYI